ncbi:hypothetical protein P7C71_g5470, partial [Lecanoromycetidae sp. Uapishka_2]
MLPPFDYFEHRRACQKKQAERSKHIADLPSVYTAPISSSDRSILSKPISELVQDVHENVLSPLDILRSYGKIAVRAHKKTNCLTEIMVPEAEKWIDEVDLKGPLAGIPVSLKDSIAVRGYDVSVGYSCNVGKPYAEDGTLVKILKAAGAIPYVKTNLPTTLLSFESSNDVWGRCLNPHNTDYSPGGSTGGESALLAYGGGRIGIGSDVAGSVRAPAHFSGIYSLRCSTGRWPKMDAGVVDPAPACARALERTVSALQTLGHDIIDVEPPSPFIALRIASQLLNADGCKTFLSFFRTGETNDPGARQLSLYMKLPRPFKYVYYLWVKYVKRDALWASLLEDWHQKSAYEQWKWVAKREAYKAQWHAWWKAEELDFMLTPVNATPAVPHGDKTLDQLPATFRFADLNGVAKGAYQHYDAERMHGLPVAVQVVGQRLQEEKVLAIMEVVEEALEHTGGKYSLLEIE